MTCKGIQFTSILDLLIRTVGTLPGDELQLDIRDTTGNRLHKVLNQASDLSLGQEISYSQGAV